jgi:hypothetical protein
MYSVYQHWDPLKVCVVGRSYPPEFYSWINVPHVRSLFEKIAIETEEDYQNIIKKLQQFGVEVLRPNLPTNTFVDEKYVPPPMTPRDYMTMIGNTLYTTVTNNCYNEIYTKVSAQNNCVIQHKDPYVNGSMVSRIGKDLYFGTNEYNDDLTQIAQNVNAKFPSTRNHIINTGGHSDGTYCPVCPGLIISLRDVPTYANTFPDWEVLYLPNQSWGALPEFQVLKTKNQGKWWIPGFEQDQDVVDTIETWLGHWVGYVEETVFDVNMLIVDPNNVIVFGYNKQVFDTLERYSITPHIVPFRHRYFWDGGIHCVTSDLHREGTMQDYFKQRG